MKKITIPLVALSALPLGLKAQSWTEQNSTSDSVLTNVSFVNPDTGYVSGVNGIILKTTDGGSNWTTQNTGITDGLAGLHFVNADTGYASGGFVGGSRMNCRLIKTINGGSTWTNINVAPTKCGGGIWFVSADTGFYAYADGLYDSSYIAKTTNGGASWNEVYSGKASGTRWISHFYFTDSQHGFASVNGGKMLKTVDGGDNWTVLNVATNLWGSGIYFLNKDEGFVGGQVMSPSTGASIYKTSDGGANWQSISSSDMIFKLTFSDNTHGYALSVNTVGAGKMIRSTDGGTSWADEVTPQQNLRGMCFLNASLGYAVGDNGVILKYSLNTGINNSDPAGNSGITLYPNPATDFFTVNTNDFDNTNALIAIYDVVGKLASSEKLLQNQKKIYVGNLSNGIYMVEIRTREGVEKCKLIVQK